MSIRVRLTMWYTALLGLVLAGFAVLVYIAVAVQLRNQIEYAIHLQALDASRAVHTVSLGRSQLQPPALHLPGPVNLANQTLYVQLVAPGGRVLASSTNLAQPLPTQPAGLQSALAGQEQHSTVTLADQQLALYSTPLLIDDQVVGVLQIAASLQPYETTLARLRLLLGGAVGGVTILAALLGWFLATKAMQPVDRMARAAHAIGSQADFSRRLPEPMQRDELGRLAGTFNEMLSRLDSAFTTQRRFLADAAHELRTPLAGIRTNTEALLRRTGTGDADGAAMLRGTLRETDRLIRLVSDLLALARADAGQPIVRQPVALDTVLIDVYQQEKALANGVKLSLGHLEQVEVEGDPDRLRQLILNITGNALQYTPSGGSVTMDLIRRQGCAVFKVTDTGHGIPPEDLDRIFERFYRGDQPRERGTSGTGLGLAICRWIAEAHQGRIEVASQLEVGSVFSVILPLRVPMG